MKWLAPLAIAVAAGLAGCGPDQSCVVPIQADGGVSYQQAMDACCAADPVCCGDPCCGDPCCGDPCCGDPCCGDPCCGDPCCGDPCCGDPNCGSLREPPKPGGALRKAPIPWTPAR